MYVGQLSMEAVDRTVRFLRDRGLSQTQALRTISLQVTVRGIAMYWGYMDLIGTYCNIQMCRYSTELMETKVGGIGGGEAVIEQGLMQLFPFWGCTD